MPILIQKKKNQEMGAVIIMKDGKGEILATLCTSKLRVSQAITTEIYALWRAMQLCTKLNIYRVIFEGDALVVVKVVNCKEENWT